MDNTLEDTPNTPNEEEANTNISEDFFWKVVEEINWSWVSSNLDKVDKNIYKFKLLKKYDISIWIKVTETYKLKYKSLRVFLRTYDVDWRTGLGDDSTWDLCSHIVGLGRKEYLDSFAYPEKLIKRANTRDFKENFGYWIPSDTKCTLPNSLDFMIDKEN